MSKPLDHTITKKKNTRNKSANKRQAQKLGRWAEFRVGLRLLATGHRILATNYKTKVGEIDLITQRRNVIGFVEVKARKTADLAAQAVTPHQRRRIERAAEQFMIHSLAVKNCDMRFDVACVTGLFRIHMIYDAWRPEFTH